MPVLETRAVRFGPLTCRVVADVDVLRAAGLEARGARGTASTPDAPSSTRTTPELVVVLCHGYGAPGADLVGMAGELAECQPDLANRVAFVFPEAPLALDAVPFGGRAWWHIDVERFQRAAATGAVDALTREAPTGLVEARRALHATIDEMCQVFHVPLGRVVLGGFSQGAMLATDLALRLEEAPAGLAILSGTIIARETWGQLAPKRRGLRVLQAHGFDDPLLPHSVAAALRDMLTEAGLQVDFVAFRGGHGIPGAVFEHLAAMLRDLPARTKP